MMYADAVGDIYTTSGKRVRLGIRPESAESAYPGDDLIPAFQAYYSTIAGDINHFDFQAKDGDYVGVYQNNWANTTVPAVAQQWGQPYAPTTAATNYHNYVKVTDRPKQKQADFPRQVTIAQQGQIGEYPYIPGFSYWYDCRNGGDNWDVSFAAAGIDCVGFVHRSIQASQAQYTGGMLFPSETILQDSSMEDYSTNSLFNWRKKPGQHSAFINVLTFRQDDIEKKTGAIKKVIPGDIFYYVTDQDGNGHIGIVLSTTSTETGAEDGIKLIESVYNTKDGIRFGGVVSYRTIRNLTENGKDWTIGRLK